MLIKEILEELLKDGENIASVAKRIRGISEKPLREALKNSGCVAAGSGHKGWVYAGEDVAVLEQSIFDFVPATKRKSNSKDKANVSNNGLKGPDINTNQRSNVPIKSAKEEIEITNQQLAPTNERTIEPSEIKNQLTKERTKELTNVSRKRSSFDIDVELMKDLKIQAIIHDRNVYEIVESAVRQYLKELKTKG